MINVYELFRVFFNTFDKRSNKGFIVSVYQVVVLSNFYGYPYAKVLNNLCTVGELDPEKRKCKNCYK